MCFGFGETKGLPSEPFNLFCPLPHFPFVTFTRSALQPDAHVRLAFARFAKDGGASSYVVSDSETLNLDRSRANCDCGHCDSLHHTSVAVPSSLLQVRSPSRCLRYTPFGRNSSRTVNVSLYLDFRRARHVHIPVRLPSVGTPWVSSSGFYRCHGKLTNPLRMPDVCRKEPFPWRACLTGSTDVRRCEVRRLELFSSVGMRSNIASRTCVGHRQIPFISPPYSSGLHVILNFFYTVAQVVDQRLAAMNIYYRTTVAEIF